MKSSHMKVVARIAIGVIALCLVLLFFRVAIGTATISHADRVQTAEVLPQPIRTMSFDNGVDYAVVTGGFRTFFFVAGSISRTDLDVFCSRMGILMLHRYPDLLPPSPFDRAVIDAGLDLNIFGFQCHTDYLSIPDARRGTRKCTTSYVSAKKLAGLLCVFINLESDI